MNFSDVPDEYDEFIGTIYNSTLEDSPWQIFLAELRERLNAAAVTLVLRRPKSGDIGLVINLGGSSKWAEAYKDTFFMVDPFVDLPAGKAMTLQELIDYDELEKSDYYQQFLHPSGVYHIMGVDNKEGEHVLSRLRVCRSIEQSPFNAEEKRLCEKLAPHIARALKINARILKMESERAIYANTVDQLSMGTILLDAQGKILQANAIATQLIQQKDVIKDHDGALQVGTREENNKFRKLLKESIAANASQQPSAVRAMRVERPSTGFCLGLLIRPVPSSEWSVDGESFPSVAVFISDAEKRAEAPRQLVGQLFDLTPAEAILATLIAKGLAIDEAAEQLHISRNTARAQLRSIFSKAGVTRQADLVRLILNSVATLG